MENNTEAIRTKWRELTATYEPQIQAARAEVDALEEEFAAVRERRNAAVDRHLKLVNDYNDRWDVAGKMGGQ